jgi:hypothetical protein
MYYLFILYFYFIFNYNIQYIRFPIIINSREDPFFFNLIFFYKSEVRRKGWTKATTTIIS